MYAKLFTLSALVAAAVAVPTGGNQCNVGSVQCCNSVQAVDNKSLQALGVANSIVGAALAVAPIDALVGLTCNPISVIGAGGNSCNAQPVCCTNNNFNGVVAVGCSPVNINL